MRALWLALCLLTLSGCSGWLFYPDREMLALSLASNLAGQLGQHLRVSDHASLCVPRGTTPPPVLYSPP